MHTIRGKASLYLLFLVIGIVLGGVAGAEFIRRVSKAALETPAAPVDISIPDTQPSEPSPSPNTPADPTASRENAIVAATREVSPCVVGVVVTQIRVVRSPDYYGDFFDLFFAPELAPRLKQVESMGSGFLISSDGLIVTNNHVVEGAAKLYVNLPDGPAREATVVGVDPQTDLALIKIQGKNYPFVKMGDSESLMTGEWAIAIGNPFGYFINDAHPTVTVGVISALNRNFASNRGEEVYYQNMIQTDAAINPGNSGGPLVNALGEVIAINTFIYTGNKATQGSIGIGFAIPIDRAKKVIHELTTYGARRPVWTGISVGNLNRSIALSLGYDKIDGMVITSIQPGSPSAKAGLREGDVIIRLGNRVIQSSKDIEGFIYDYFVGDQVGVTFIRRNKENSLVLTLRELPAGR